MAEQEGVIKFQLDYHPSEPLPASQLTDLNAWRTICHQTALIGQDPARYDGYGFGNISQRLGDGDTFAISGTQTGKLATLDPRHYAIVEQCDPHRNRVVARGPMRPSSEAMTHGMIYAQDPAIRFVIHVHAPELWRHTADLNIPTTAAHIPYGTPAIAAEVARLFQETAVRHTHILSMGGHEDGLIAFGNTPAAAGGVLMQMHGRALALSLASASP